MEEEEWFQTVSNKHLIQIWFQFQKSHSNQWWWWWWWWWWQCFPEGQGKNFRGKGKNSFAYIACEIFCLVLAKLAEPPHCLFRDVNLWRSKIWRLCSALAPPVSVTTSLSPSPPRWQVQINPFCKLYNMGVAYIVGHYWCLTCTWNTEHQNLLL